MGVTKQTILYHFKSKDGLLDAVVLAAADELAAALGRDIATVPEGWERVEVTVRSAFALAIARPELVGLLREVGRLGPPRSDRIIHLLEPLADAAIQSLEAGMAAGRFQTSDARMLLVSAYAAVTGVVSDTEVLRVVGLELDIRVAARLRRTILAFLRSVLIVEAQ